MPRRIDRDEEFRRFAVGFAPVLIRTAYMLLGDLDAAEDAVQATMLSVFRSWDRARAAPEAYSRQTLVNICRDGWRARRRRREELPGDDALPIVATESFTGAVERRQAIVQALGQLSEVQREVLVLRFFMDLSLEDTAAALKLPVGTVKSATHRGLSQLRKLLTLHEEAEAC